MSGSGRRADVLLYCHPVWQMELSLSTSTIDNMSKEGIPYSSDPLNGGSRTEETPRLRRAARRVVEEHKYMLRVRGTILNPAWIWGLVLGTRGEQLWCRYE